MKPLLVKGALAAGAAAAAIAGTVLALQGSGAGGATAWFDHPLDGAVVPPGPVQVLAHVGDPDGVEHIELRVDDTVVGEGAPTDPGAPLVTASWTWEPPGPGSFLLEVRGRNGDGEWGQQATAMVVVGADVPEVAPPLEPETSPSPTPSPDAAPNAAPAADFAATCDGFTCEFMDLSEDDEAVVGWVWDFGDGVTSTDQHPSHTYAKAGTFTVRLTVADAEERFDTSAQKVEAIDAVPSCARGAPVLTQPGDGSIPPTNPPSLVWEYSCDPGRFIVQLSQDSDFGYIEHVGKVAGHLRTWTPAEELGCGSWFWRVRARDAASSGPWAQANFYYVCEVT